MIQPRPFERRRFLASMLGAFAAPAIVPASSLMSIRPLPAVSWPPAVETVVLDYRAEMEFVAEFAGVIGSKMRWVLRTRKRHPRETPLVA